MFKFLKRLIVLVFVIFCGYQVYVTHENVHNVLQYKSMVKEILDDNDTTANVELVLAMIYTETKGNDGDVMQSKVQTVLLIPSLIVKRVFAKGSQSFQKIFL